MTDEMPLSGNGKGYKLGNIDDLPISGGDDGKGYDLNDID